MSTFWLGRCAYDVWTERRGFIYDHRKVVLDLARREVTRAKKLAAVIGTRPQTPSVTCHFVIGTKRSEIRLCFHFLRYKHFTVVASNPLLKFYAGVIISLIGY